MGSQAGGTGKSQLRRGVRDAAFAATCQRLAHFNARFIQEFWMPDAASPTDGAQSSNSSTMDQDALLWLGAAGDAVIAIACLGLALLLLRAVQQRSDWPRAALLTLAACLSLLAATHAVAIGNLWSLPAWLLIGVKQAAAAATLISLICAWRQLPRLLSLPTREELASSRAALASSNEELESFMSSVSHDLRSPLTTIAGQAGLLELSLGTQASDDLKRRVQRIHHSVRHMSQLIEALLALARVARHELRPEPLDISTLAQQTLDELQRKEPQRTVNVTIQPGLHALADRRLASDLLAHLLGNAWKFTARTQDARIEVGAVGDGRTAALCVRDNGAGFDMTYAPKLFKPFQRLHPPSEFEGAGIGLASAARIVSRHGGKIWAEATPKAGAVFYFTLAQPHH
jgi:signal transduction histidine kinase